KARQASASYRFRRWPKRQGCYQMPYLSLKRRAHRPALYLYTASQPPCRPSAGPPTPSGCRKAAQPAVIASLAILGVRRIRQEPASACFFDQHLDPILYFVKNPRIDRVRNDGSAGRAKEQVTSIDLRGIIGAQDAAREPRIYRNLERLPEQLRCHA